MPNQQARVHVLQARFQFTVIYVHSKRCHTSLEHQPKVHGWSSQNGQSCPKSVVCSHLPTVGSMTTPHYLSSFGTIISLAASAASAACTATRLLRRSACAARHVPAGCAGRAAWSPRLFPAQRGLHPERWWRDGFGGEARSLRWLCCAAESSDG